ncbi:serine/threonine protein kinase [Corallococcus macrosporus]|uniref:non-specific serine/threonine protein kinase n=1 Tax=Corallococcus macrosporus DSM 14697 TaxID=1189310 RepID=A0A250JR63_9BACT|nr:serine/threonine-protein kinase [Corallococcus macrosporus]ATB46364.1 protein kinase [Corallococcus macrosporus DSM 14697]
MRDDGPPAVLSPGDVVMGYTVVSQLGRGGFGTVYLATHDGQPSALKLVERRRMGGRVEREVSILLRLKHANVVGIRGFSFWQEGEHEFAIIVMEYVEGRQLDAWVKEENPSAREVARVTLDVARALAASHEAGVVHRDVKESNVMVRDADGVAVVVDYGVGDYKGAPGVTQSMIPPGTTEYRPPEMWRFMENPMGGGGTRYVPGPADDVWALGVVLYRLLTARWPFEAEDDQAFINAVLTQSPVPPHVANRYVPEKLGMLCMRLLEKEPAERPEASAVCDALAEVLVEAEGEAWDSPLCDTYGPHSATTEGEVDELMQWAKVPLRQLRRGNAPGPELPEAPSEGPPAELLPQAAPVAAATPPVEAELLGSELEEGLGAAESAAESALAAPIVEVGRRSFFSRLRVGRVLGVGLLVGALAAGALLSQRTPPAPEAQAPSAPGQEVATYTKKPQAARAAAPTGPEATPAAVAPPATLPEVTATVTTLQSDTPSSPPMPAKKAARNVRNVLATMALCGALGCTGPQVRSPPEPEPCPEGATEGMKRLGLGIGGEETATFPINGPPKVITVKEGTAQVRLLDGRTFLSGRFIVGDRLYGRLTRARTSKGTFPVCLELQDTSGMRGLEIESGGGDSGEVRVFSTVTLRAVREFE